MFLTHITWCTHGLCTGWMWLCTISIVCQKAITILCSTVLHMLNKDLLFVSTFRLLSKSECLKKKVLVVKIKNCVPLIWHAPLVFDSHVYQLHPGIMVSWKMNWLSRKSSTSNLTSAKDHFSNHLYHLNSTYSPTQTILHTVDQDLVLSDEWFLRLVRLSKNNHVFYFSFYYLGWML